MSSSSGPETPCGAGPGECHWHGAAPDHLLLHLAIWDGLAERKDGPATEWGEQVTDAEYG